MDIKKIRRIYSWISKENRKKILNLIYGIKSDRNSSVENLLMFCFKTLRVGNALSNLKGVYAFLGIYFAKKHAPNDVGREVLLIVGKDYLIEGLNYNGSTKDIQSLIEDLKLNHIRFKLVLVSRKSLHAWIDLKTQMIDGVNRRYFSDVIVSIPGASGFFLPGLKILGFSNIHFRSHNAEVLHRIDWLRAEVGIVGRLRILKRVIFGAISDLLVAYLSTTILMISKVEINKYWNKWFPLCKKKFVYFPYKPPSHLVKITHDRKPKERFVLIVGPYHSGTKISEADKDFLRNGAKIRDYFNREGFELNSVGNGVYYDFCDLNCGFVEDIDLLMRSADFVLIPTSRGWGFKTKILDALFNNIGVIVSVDLAQRSAPYSEFYSVVTSWSAIEGIQLNIPTEEAFTALRLELNSERSVFFQNLTN